MLSADKEIVLGYIGQLSLDNYLLTRELKAKEEEIVKLRAMVEKLSVGKGTN